MICSVILHRVGFIEPAPRVLEEKDCGGTSYSAPVFTWAPFTSLPGKTNVKYDNRSELQGPVGRTPAPRHGIDSEAWEPCKQPAGDRKGGKDIHPSVHIHQKPGRVFTWTSPCEIFSNWVLKMFLSPQLQGRGNISFICFLDFFFKL